MNEKEEIRFIDLYSGVGGFRRGLERANEERRLLRRQNMHGHSADADECLEHGREAPGGHISQESPRDRGFLQEEGDAEGLRGDSPLPERRSSWLKSDITFRCVWSCDNNKYANQVYAKQFGEANHHTGDVRGVDPGDIPDFDLLCAGFPCPSFSVAGPRTGFKDPRGTLFFEISRIAEAKRPQMLLLENVKGLLSNDRGQTFEAILQELGRIGYWTEWQIFNSKHHGVPQNRERVFLIGHLRNGRSRPIFPIGETDEMAKEDGRGRPPVQPEVSTAIDGSYYKGVDRHGQRTVVLDTFNRGAKEEEAYSLKTNPSITSSAVIGVELAYTKANMRQGRFSEVSHALDRGASKGVAISFTNPHDSEEERKVNLGEVSRTVKPPYGNQQPLVLRWQNKQQGVVVDDKTPALRASGGTDIRKKPVILHNIYGGFKEGIRTFEEHSPTIRTAKGGGHLPSVLQDFRIRRLTPVECERLQGFPSGWTAQGICKKGDIVWTGKYKARVEIDEDGLEVTRYRPIMTKAKADGIYPISDTQRYRALGNAVTVNVITFLGRRIMEAEGDGD